MKPYEVENLREGLPVAVILLVMCWLLCEGVVALFNRCRGQWLWPVLAYAAFGLLAALVSFLSDRTHPGPARIAVVLTAYMSRFLSLPYLVARLCRPGSSVAKCSAMQQTVLVALAFAMPYA